MVATLKIYQNLYKNRSNIVSQSCAEIRRNDWSLRSKVASKRGICQIYLSISEREQARLIGQISQNLIENRSNILSRRDTQRNADFYENNLLLVGQWPQNLTKSNWKSIKYFVSQSCAEGRRFYLRWRDMISLREPCALIIRQYL